MYTSIKTCICFILMLMLANGAIAKNCYESSPRLIALGDKYYDLDDNRRLSDDEKQALQELFADINGDWQGKFSIVDCKGPDTASRKEVKDANITADVSFDSSSTLRVDADLYYPDIRATRKNKLVLFGNSPVTSLSIINDDKVIVVEKYRAHNVAAGTQATAKRSRLIEKVYEIKLSENALQLDIFLYVNGVFASEEIWMMSR